MAHQGRYSGLGETEVVGNAGEAVAKDVRRNVFKNGVLDQLLPVLGKGGPLQSFLTPADHALLLAFVRLEVVPAPYIENATGPGGQTPEFPKGITCIETLGRANRMPFGPGAI
jgi:hypothetical protein